MKPEADASVPAISDIQRIWMVGQGIPAGRWRGSRSILRPGPMRSRSHWEPLIQTKSSHAREYASA